MILKKHFDVLNDSQAAVCLRRLRNPDATKVILFFFSIILFFQMFSFNMYWMQLLLFLFPFSVQNFKTPAASCKMTGNQLQLYLGSFLCYLAGFILWNLDNHTCPTLQFIRAALPPFLRPFIQVLPIFYILFSRQPPPQAPV